MSDEKKSSRRLIIRLAVVFVVLIVVLYAFFSLTSASEIKAELHVEMGDVSVNGAIVSGGVELNEGDIVETGNGLATIILYESVVVNLDQNTRVVVKDLLREHPKLEQESGRTWNTFTKLAGVEDYSISEGNSIASVRATAFGLEKDKIVGGEGETDYRSGNREFLVGKMRVVELIGGDIVEREASEEEIREIRESVRRTIKELKYLRERAIEDQTFLEKLIVKSFSGKVQVIEGGQVIGERDLTERELYDYLDSSGDIRIEGNLPIRVESLEKIAEITKAINDFNDILEKKESSDSDLGKVEVNSEESFNEERIVLNDADSNEIVYSELENKQILDKSGNYEKPLVSDFEEKNEIVNDVGIVNNNEFNGGNVNGDDSLKVGIIVKERENESDHLINSVENINSIGANSFSVK